SDSSHTVAGPWALLQVHDTPAITTQPQDQFVTAGLSATFSVVASGSAPLYYQWYYFDPYYGTTPINSANDATLTLNGVHEADEGFYYVEVSNQWGDYVDSSLAVLLTTPDIAPSITVQPQSQTIIAGGNVTLAVSATGTSPLTYQWQFKDSDMSGE